MDIYSVYICQHQIEGIRYKGFSVEPLRHTRSEVRDHLDWWNRVESDGVADPRYEWGEIIPIYKLT